MKDGFLKFEKITGEKAVSAFDSINHLWRVAFLLRGPSLRRPKERQNMTQMWMSRVKQRSSRPVCWDSPQYVPAAKASSSLILWLDSYYFAARCNQGLNSLHYVMSLYKKLPCYIHYTILLWSLTRLQAPKRQKPFYVKEQWFSKFQTIAHWWVIKLIW